jgi:endonuclease YncB( thermonuclease family)
MKMIARVLLTVIVVATLASPAFAKPKCFAAPGQTVSGAITHYVDGDTFDIAKDRIRPWGIDATERGEFGYNEATQTLRTITRGRSVSCVVKYLDTTKDKRCVATCEVSGVGDLGETMLRSGWVRIHPSYINQDGTLRPRYEAAQREAREAKRGLWR